MSLATRALAAALFLGSSAFAGDTTESAWIQDFAKAQAKATSEKKDLLIDFTGSDWCVWCKKLDAEVFTQGDFEKKIQEQFVLVKLDFPRDAKLVTPEIKKQNEGLMTRFGVQGFPTIFLTDAGGKPYAKTGYQEGGPEKYMTHVAGLRDNKAKFADAVVKAGEKKGADKAKALDEALGLLDAELLMPFYEKEVKEIIALDEKGEAGLKTKYDEICNTFAETQAMSELQNAIGPLFEKKDFDGCMKVVDEFVTKHKEKNVKLAQNAAMMKVGILMQGKKFDDAVKAVEAAKLLDPKSEIGQQADQIVAQIKMIAANGAGAGDDDDDDDDDKKDGEKKDGGN